MSGDTLDLRGGYWLVVSSCGAWPVRYGSGSRPPTYRWEDRATADEAVTYRLSTAL